MRILFLCSSLEPGKDGVGDYTLKLATAFAKLGHNIRIIALNDRHIQKPLTIPASEIYKLRLPSAYTWNKRMELAGAFTHNFKPDWISLQYVPFGFHLKGLPLGLSKHILMLRQNAQLHIMFHELWVGFNQQISVKLKAWSFVQQAIIKSFLQKLQPAVISTNTLLYKNLLAKKGFKSEVMPLFSNIEMKNNVRQENRYCKQFVVFGMIHRTGEEERFLKALKMYATKADKEVKIMFAGNNGIEKENWINICRQYEIDCGETGWLDEAGISDILLQSDFGITTTPYEITGKSGSVAAMFAHGLPVICLTKNMETEITDAAQQQVFLFNSYTFEQFLQKNLLSKPVNTAEKTALLFLEILKNEHSTAFAEA